MPIETLYALGENQMTVSGGGQLSGITGGDGSHLAGLTITLNNNNWEAMAVLDTEDSFDDSDNSQRLSGDQSFDGTMYTDDSRVEAEYGLTLQDPDGNTYTVVGFNINEGGGASYATVEGLAFVGGVAGFPPIGVPLTVIATYEGPSVDYVDLATPPCFTQGALVKTPGGLRAVEQLREGDMVVTRDNGGVPVRKVLSTRLPGAVLRREPQFRPILFRRDAIAPGVPARDTWLSPQHRVLVTGWKAQLFFGEPEVLVPATRLVNGISIHREPRSAAVSYIHLLLEDHEILTVDGLDSESFFPDEMSAAGAEEMRQLFGNDQGAVMQTARTVARGPGCRLLGA
ncbi:Hint domain-containing protein [Shimia gijangensis]|uniref:Hint domain-containing protein n=1 Tax=Shimia gijangensis TaxID=1470563 RepID=A0A1M6G115_9RHOB|nr:Hint domain-containing protein [Shimia gijangensis]SHJ03661.1 Hint domain-containing protein [Shimia gijangensis]